MTRQQALSGKFTTRRFGWVLVLLLLVQFTAPFFVTDCPVYSMTGVKAGHAGMVNCPLAAAPVKDGSHKSHVATCVLCDMLVVSNGMVTVTLPVLPAMLVVWQSFAFSENTRALLRRIATASFAARAPPFCV